MRESTYTRAVAKLLPATVYAWKIASQFANGVPDSWYSGRKADLWVEWKYVHNLPKRIVHPKLSELQRAWLDARYKEGRNVAAIVGSPQGAIIFTDLKWNQGLPPNDPLSKHDVATWITDQVDKQPHLLG